MAESYTSCDTPSCWYDGTCNTTILNTDIAGRGVISAYIASALLAVICFGLAYVTYSLPDGYCNMFDGIVLFNRRGKLRILERARGYSLEKRIESFERFLLTLSDQQLVSGFAVIVGGLAPSTKATYADFKIVTTLATFSSIVHLVTLVMLRSHFQSYLHRFYYRLVLIIPFLALLMYSMITSDWTFGEYPGLPIVCVESDLGIDYNIIASIIWLLVLFSRPILTIAAPSVLSAQVLYLFFYKSSNIELRRLLKSRKTRKDFVDFLDNELELDALSAEPGYRKYMAIFLCYWVESFLFELGSAVYLISYGLTSFFYSYLQSYDVQPSNEVGFGQILPLLLLIIPLISALESFWEIRDDRQTEQDDESNDEHVDTEVVSQKSSKNSEHAEESIQSFDPEPPSKRVDHAFAMKRLLIEQALPLEYMALEQLPADQVRPAKQSLLALLKNIEIRRHAVARSCKKWFIGIAFIDVSYAILQGYLGFTTSSAVVAILIYLPSYISLLIPCWPFFKAMRTLANGESSDRKKRYMRFLRLSAKKDGEDGESIQSGSSVVGDDLGDLRFRRKWTV